MGQATRRKRIHGEIRWHLKPFPLYPVVVKPFTSFLAVPGEFQKVVVNHEERDYYSRKLSKTKRAGRRELAEGEAACVFCLEHLQWKGKSLNRGCRGGHGTCRGNIPESGLSCPDQNNGWPCLRCLCELSQ